ncbi:MAG: glycoside hydrolase family 5 protein [Bacteriovoracaceae bacterium]
MNHICYTIIVFLHLMMFKAFSATDSGKLHTKNNKIYNEKGQVVILKGVNIADPEQINTKPWERPNVDAKIIATKATENFYAKVVRIPVLPGKKNEREGFLNNKDSYFNNHLKPLVDDLTRKGIYVIVDLHYVSDYDKVTKEVEEFWTFMAPKFKDNPHVLYEIFNEPIRPDSWSTWKKLIADPMYTLIRKHAPDNLILIGGPFWSSHIEEAATNAVKGTNIVYTGHIYKNQTPDQWDKLYGAVIKKHPLFITEWGFEAGGTEGGDIEYGKKFSAWMEKHGLSWTAFAFDSKWGPRMFNDDWSLKPAPHGMGDLVKELLSLNHQNSVIKNN